MEHEISSGGADGRSRDESTRYDPRDLWSARSDDYEGACIERSCASVRVDTTAGDDQPVDTMVEGEDGVQVVGGVPAFAEAVLGAPHVGARVFLLQQRQCDR